MRTLMMGFRNLIARPTRTLLTMFGIILGVSVIIAGVAGLYAKSGYETSCALASRITPQRGQQLVDVSIATIRSVTNGVLGVAVIQAVLAGIGLAVMGVPHGGIIAGIVLITSIIQVPALLIIAPVVFWVFSLPLCSILRPYSTSPTCILLNILGWNGSS